MSFPKSFVQIHYHDRPGGVTTVMRLYAQAFRRIAGAGTARSVAVCAGSGGRLGGAVRVVAEPACDYAEFRSKRAFLSVREQLIDRLQSVVDDPALARPVCVVGHNLSLGKNLALTSAFAALARGRGGGDDIRFFSVVHDFAEEGRCDMMRNIRRAASWGWAIRRDMYPSEYGVRFVAFNRRNHRLLRAAKAAAFFLPNPVEEASPIRLSRRQRAGIEAGLSALARSDGTCFYPQRATVFYPVRVVSRKNVAEAIILCCVLSRANLIIGPCGTSRGDKALFETLRSLCRQHGLGVVFDVERLASKLPGSMGGTSGVVPLLYAYCDCAVSTSVAEGFGYALYEPWLHGKAVFGRRPLGLTVPDTMDMDHLYEGFWVSEKLVSVSRLARQYRHGMRVCFGRAAVGSSLKAFEKRLRREFVRNGCLDFGVLDLAQQLSILQRVACDAGVRGKGLWDPIRIDGRRGILDHRSGVGKAMVERNRRAVHVQFCRKAFDQAFKACFGRASVRCRTGVHPRAIERAFRTLSSYRLLLDAGRAPS